MATSITEYIMANVATTLRGITTGNGYEQTVKEVKRFTTPAQIKFSKYPAADFVIDFIDKNDSEDFEWQICTAHLIIHVYIEDRSESLPASLTNFHEDVEKALAVDVTRGGYALDTAVVRVEPLFIDSDMGDFNGAATIDVEILYQHRRNNPYSKEQ